MSATPARLFGTDGIRGRFGEPPLDRPTVTALARHLAADLAERVAAAAAAAGPAAAVSPAGAALGAATLLAARPAAAIAATPPLVVLGGDTRDSTPEICAWLAAGLAAGGVRVRYAGVIPTPGIAFLAPHLGATAGIAVSASHNPWPDNGIKLLDGDGLKWSDAAEQALTARLAAPHPLDPTEEPPAAAALPPVDADLRAAYLEHLAATLPPEPSPLAGLRVVLDAGNGAAATYAGDLFDRLGAEVTLLGTAPDGRNVNRGIGSTAPETMAAAVVAAGAHLGAAFDGDADRCILADETGAVCDGDAILYLWATGLLAAGQLVPPRIVATSMSNLGLERALARHGIGVVRCDVGDRWVVEAMRREGIRLGGEQSGHIVCFGLSNTGDGLLTALQCAAHVHRSGQPLSRLLAGFRRYPQILRNVRVARKPDLATLPRVAAAVQDVERALCDDGRLVLRYSGTEPLVRVMIEGPDQTTIESLAAQLAAVLAGELSEGAA
jgi:phosphoglucosamine mutase